MPALRFGIIFKIEFIMATKRIPKVKSGENVVPSLTPSFIF